MVSFRVSYIKVYLVNTGKGLQSLYQFDVLKKILTTMPHSKSREREKDLGCGEREKDLGCEERERERVLTNK